jgi:UDP-2,3-diacylglucosamine pyrophosphatase LpxH
MKVRELEVAVISDLHLATHACKPKKILKYLKSIQPKLLVLNGDIIDSWRFSRNYFPKNHLKVVRQLIKMMEKEIEIYYITGNHDEFLRKFIPAHLGNLKIVNQLILELNETKTWIFHGDIFDRIILKNKWLAKLGAASYGFLTLLNNILNQGLKLFGKSEIIIYKSLKKRLVKDKPTLSGFEKSIGIAATSQGYQTVICGHTHLPKEKIIEMNGKQVQYINCGDWVEHFTAAEYNNGAWQLYLQENTDDELQPDEADIPEKGQLFKKLVTELMYPNII